MIQSADIAGRYNTVVQIVGDGNTVVASHAHLELYLPPKVESPQGIELLDPKSRAIPFIGRVDELNSLRAWLGSEKPVAVRVLTGGAGAGKTRLALHLCELAQADRWDAGFADSAELTRFRSQQNLASWGWQRPTLIVIDYAALHAQQIQDWLRELGKRNRRDGKPLRLLLLERFAEPDRGWWQTAFGRGSFGLLAVQRMLDPPQPIPLNPLGADERRAVLDATLEQAGSPLRAPKGESAIFKRQLEEMGEPLFLMMAGLRAADTGITSALSLNKTELALALADRELERIERHRADARRDAGDVGSSRRLWHSVSGTKYTGGDRCRARGAGRLRLRWRQRAREPGRGAGCRTAGHRRVDRSGSAGPDRRGGDPAGARGGRCRKQVRSRAGVRQERPAGRRDAYPCGPGFRRRRS